MEQEPTTPLDRASELLASYQLSRQSVIFQSVYIAGGQEAHRDILRKNYCIDNERLKNPQDPDNPSESMHYISWNMHFEHEEKLGLKNVVPRREAFFIAASLLVHEMLLQSTGSVQPVQVPKLAPEHIKYTFGDFITFRQ